MIAHALAGLHCQAADRAAAPCAASPPTRRLPPAPLDRPAMILTVCRSQCLSRPLPRLWRSRQRLQGRQGIDWQLR
eukprot:3724082-Alexandrium_andersonii.AAC.1